MKKWIAILVLLGAAAVWGWRFLQPGATKEAALRQTAGVTALVLGAQPTPQGWQVRCRVVNERQYPAEQVVLNVRLTDSVGRVLAANPLASVPDLAPVESREVAFVVPLRDSVTNAHARAEVSLVLWRR